MRKVRKIFNILIIGVLGLFILGFITSEDYKDVVIIAPLFMRDFTILGIYVFTVLAIYSALEASANKVLRISLLFIAFSILSFRLAYLSHPEVKMDMLFEKVKKYRFDEEAYNEAKQKYLENDALEYFYLVDLEVKMFENIYNWQYEYLKEYVRFKNPYTDPQFLFFSILGLLLFMNGLFYSKTSDSS